MATVIHILDETPVRLWDLSLRERVRRLMRRKGGLALVDSLAQVQAADTVLLLRGDYLMDARTLWALTDAPGTVLRAGVDEKAVRVAAHVPAALAPEVAARLQAPGTGESLPGGLRTVSAEDLTPAFQERLRKADPPFVLPITEGSRAELERLLFGAAYKGITDLVTRFVWPVPAQWGVRFCAHWGITPNQVTALNWALATAVLLLFGHGHFGWGLPLAWLMTYLDTVDGKLARVTVTSSTFGHFFDHILDLISPPFWYLAWAVGLSSYQPLLLPASVKVAVWLLFVGYILGRLTEGAFKQWLGRFGIFCWRKLDSYSRLVTARRNPSLILLTLGALAGRPDLGLEAVTLWTLLSSAFLLARLVMAYRERASAGPLVSWLEGAGKDPTDRSLAVRWFAGGGGRSPEGRRG